MLEGLLRAPASLAGGSVDASVLAAVPELTGAAAHRCHGLPVALLWLLPLQGGRGDCGGTGTGAAVRLGGADLLGVLAMSKHEMGRRARNV